MTIAKNFGALLATIGNHEGKALLYLAMEPGEAYAVSALHRLFLSIQGDRPAFAGTVNLQQKYCMYSFEPAGLVQRTTSERGSLAHVKPEDSILATALAGHLLGTIESHPATLNQIFGKTTAPSGFSRLVAPHPDGPDVRPPLRRLAVLRALADCAGQQHTASLARKAAVSDSLTGHILAEYARIGLLAYRTAPTYVLKSRYRLVRPLPLDGRTLETAVAVYANGRLSRDGGLDGLMISRSEIEAHIASLPAWREKAGIADRVQKVMMRLADRGLIEVLEAYTGQHQHSLIEMTSAQQSFIAQLADGTDRIAAGDATALRDGTRKAHEIIADPQRVRALVAKAFAAMKRIVNPLTLQQKQNLILSALSQDSGISSAALLERLGNGFNKPALAITLSQLVREGRVRGVKQPDGPYKHWYLS